MTVTGADEAVRDALTDSVTFAFGDPAAQVYGLARIGLAESDDGARQGSALAVLFAGREPVAAFAEGALPVDPGAGWDALALGALRTTVEQPLTGWSVAFDAADGQGFELSFEALGEPAALGGEEPAARLGGMTGYDQPCRVRGTARAGGRELAIDGLGQRGHAWGAPDWDRIELARTVAAWTDEASAALTSVRPTGAAHHDEEAVWAAVWEAHGLVAVEDGRLSTTYDADGHTRRAGLELWPAGDEEWARRAAGEVLCGSSLDLGALRLDCAFFRWHLEGREGVGRYDILRRAA